MSLFNDEDWLAGSPRAGSSRGTNGPQSFLDRLSSVAPTEGYEGNFGSIAGSVAGDVEPIAEGEEVFTATELSPGSDEDELDDVRRLARIWVRERGTPAILAWEGDVLDSLLDKVEQQVSGAAHGAYGHEVA